MKRSRTPMTVTIIVLFLLYIPILLLMANSFNASRYGGTWTHFSLEWYRLLFREPDIWLALRNSLIVATLSTAIASVLGTLSAFALFRFKTVWQKFHLGLIYLPLVVPDLLMGISLLLWFVSLSIPLGLPTILLAHITFCLSYVTVTVLSRLYLLDFSVIEAAQDLGANAWTTMAKVVIPLITPAIIAGALISFTMSLDDFIITSFVAGPGSSTLPLYVYGMIKHGATPLIAALSTLLVIVTFAIITLSHRLTREETA